MVVGTPHGFARERYLWRFHRRQATNWASLGWIWPPGCFHGRAADERPTKKRKQTVRVPLPLLAHVRRWSNRGQRYVVEWNGKPVSRIDKAHRAAVDDAGLGKDVTPHVWRHSVATWLMQAGVHLWEASGFLGMSVETLQRVYGHHHPDHSAGVHAAFHAHRRLRAANDMPMIKATDCDFAAPFITVVQAN